MQENIKGKQSVKRIYLQCFPINFMLKLNLKKNSLFKKMKEGDCYLKRKLNLRQVKCKEVVEWSFHFLSTYSRDFDSLITGMN